MTASKGWYSLIQFCPDPSRAEAANIGVLLFCPEHKFIAARTSQGNDRPRKFFGTGTFDPHQINAAKKAIEDRLEVERDRFRTLDDLQKFIDTRANEVYITPPRPMRVEDPASDLAELFGELVGGRARRPAPPPAVEILGAAFKRLQGNPRVFVNKPFTVPVIERQITAPYAYQNGVLNLIKPEAFPDEARRADNVALRLAAEGELIEGHSAKVGTPARLVVVSASGAAEAAHAIEERLSRLFAAFPKVTFVPHAGLGSFVQRVEQEVQPH